MVICIVALVVFGFLSIFSAKYRPIAKDAFKCVFKMIQFKPCDVGLETKIKTAVTSKLMIIPSLARFFYKYFKYISWAFTIAFFVSLGYSIYGIYNIIVYGSCDPTNPASCVITSQSAQNQIVTQIVLFLSCYELYIVYLIVGIVAVAIVAFSIYYLKKNHKVTNEQPLQAS